MRDRSVIGGDSWFERFDITKQTTFLNSKISVACAIDPKCKLYIFIFIFVEILRNFQRQNLLKFNNSKTLGLKFTKSSSYYVLSNNTKNAPNFLPKIIFDFTEFSITKLFNIQ
jgi:hypothetical protein